MLYRRALTREMGLTTGAVLTVLIVIALVILFVRLLGDVARGELANEAVFAFLGFSLLYFLPVLMTIALFAGVLLPCRACGATAKWSSGSTPDSP